MTENQPLLTLYWENKRLYLVDQRLLPGKIRYRGCKSAEEVAEAIRDMVVRGAPAIGVSAAFGMVLAALDGLSRGCGPAEIRERLKKSAVLLKQSRPTAVNLAWALERMERRLETTAGAAAREIAAALEEEALSILQEDRETNRLIGANGAELVPPDASVLTHCNAGALATAGFGTALGVVRAAFSQGKLRHVYVDETRPLLQGARLTALELVKENIPATLVTDNCAGGLMAAGKVDLVVVGADRIAANGDTANKIGTYNLAVLARYHGIPFYVAAPCSTIDPAIATGREIVIEERDPSEVTHINGRPVAPAGIKAFNPAFDVTPAELIDAMITERGVIHRPDEKGIRRLLDRD